MSTFKRLLAKYVLLWLTLGCALGLLWPRLFGNLTDFNPFVLTSRGLTILISATMLCVGSLLPYEEVRGVAKNWPKVIGGTAVQYLSMPTLAFLIAKLFHFEGAAFIGIMMAGCVPGAMASNVLTMTARGNVSYSVGLTTSATLLSPVVVPATLVFFLKSGHIHMDYGQAMLDLLMTVVAPVALGFVMAQRWSWWQSLANKVAEIVANLAIIWIIASVVSKNAGSMMKMTPILIGAMFLLNFGGYLAGWLGGAVLRITPGMRRALIIEVGMQNAGLGATLAMKYFEDQPEASLFCASYSFLCMATGAILAQVFRAASERSEKKAALEEVPAKMAE